jgi:hypothetical protein
MTPRKVRSIEKKGLITLRKAENWLLNSILAFLPKDPPNIVISSTLKCQLVELMNLKRLSVSNFIDKARVEKLSHRGTAKTLETSSLVSFDRRLTAVKFG